MTKFEEILIASLKAIDSSTDIYLTAQYLNASSEDNYWVPVWSCLVPKDLSVNSFASLIKDSKAEEYPGYQVQMMNDKYVSIIVLEHADTENEAKVLAENYQTLPFKNGKIV